MSDCGPSGCRQFAPATWLQPDTGSKTSPDAFQRSDGVFGSGVHSAVVTCPVASTNRANCAFVTSVLSMKKPRTRTSCSGCSSGAPSFAPIVHLPGGSHTISPPPA